MDHFSRLSIFLIIFIIYFGLTQSNAQQSKSYEIIPAPDLWYNDVDGIRVGLRLKGQVPGTFEDGPHRIDAGVWLGTWIPSDPVSYYFNYTQPIGAISDFGSEGNVQVTSSFRGTVSDLRSGGNRDLMKKILLKPVFFTILKNDSTAGILNFHNYGVTNGTEFCLHFFPIRMIISLAGLLLI